MNIQPQNNNMNFGATLISKTTVKRKIPFTPFYRNVNASFIRLNAKEDLQPFSQYCIFCNKGTQSVDALLHLKKEPNIQTIFALTLQEKQVQVLEPEKILGVCDCYILQKPDEPPFLHIHNLEAQSVKNKYAKFQNNEINLFGLKIKHKVKHKGIGKSLIKELVRYTKSKLPDINQINLVSLSGPIPFYRKLKLNETINDTFYLERKDFDQFLRKK